MDFTSFYSTEDIKVSSIAISMQCIEEDDFQFFDPFKNYVDQSLLTVAFNSLRLFWKINGLLQSQLVP